MKLIIVLVVLQLAASYVVKRSDQQQQAVEESANLDERMRELRETLKSTFEKANEESRESVEAFGKLLKQAFQQIGNKNETLARELKETHEYYKNVTKSATLKYLKGIQLSIVNFFQNLGNGTAAMENLKKFKEAEGLALKKEDLLSPDDVEVDITLDNANTTLRERMERLDGYLKQVFGKANDEAKESVKTFGELLKNSFKLAGNPKNETLRQQLKERHEYYKQITKDSVNNYLRGIKDSLERSFDALFRPRKFEVPSFTTDLPTPLPTGAPATLIPGLL